jgi:hypothetical protein
MILHSSPTYRAFTILESLIMLALIAVFSMVTIAVIKTGVTSRPGSNDAEWKKKGGDASASTVPPLLNPPLLTPIDRNTPNSASKTETGDSLQQ